MSPHATRRLAFRLLAALAVVLTSLLPAQLAAADPSRDMRPAPAPTAITSGSELAGVCALKSNGLIRWASGPGDCSKNELYVALKPGPVDLCVQPSGSTRTVTTLGQCRKPALAVVVPPPSGAVWFCATTSSGALRYVTDPSQCQSGEVPVVVTPNDSAPTVVSTAPATGATGQATSISPSVTFSEPVTLDAGALSLTCGGSSVAGAVTGSGTATATFDPTALLPADATCVLTVAAAKVHDVDTLDPPDLIAADVTVTFSTDAAPHVVSITPADGATGVATGDSVVVAFSEPVNVAAGAVSLSCAGVPVAATVSGSGTTTVTLDPTADLAAATTCTVTVTAAGITDVDAADPPDTLGADVTSSFTTADAAPSVVSISPASGQLNVPQTSDIVVTFSEPVNAESGAVFLMCPIGEPRPVTLTGSPGTTITAHPLDSLPLGAGCSVTVVAQYVTDVDLVDPPDNPADDVTSLFVVASDSPPTDLALSPATVAENQPIGTLVGTLSTTDPDVGDTFTYDLVAGVGDTDNASFSIVGAGLSTTSVFDFETTPSYSIRVRSTDAAGQSVEKQLTVTVTNLNEPPSSATLSASTVQENQPAGTTVGTLSATDPDAGQTLSFSVVAAGCGGSYPDGSAFGVSGSTLVTGQPLNFATQSTYAVCIRVSDDGIPSLSTDTLFTVTVINANDPPVATPDSYSGVVGNTYAVLGTTQAGAVVLTGAKLIGNDSDPDGDPITAVVESAPTTLGGTVSIAADGSFTYLPPVGVKSQNDSFTYHVTDGIATTAGTASIAIGSTLVWYVDNASAAPVHDGRSSSPLTDLTSLNGAGGAGDLDSSGDIIFVATGSAAYAGGLRLEANEQLLGSLAGLTVGGQTLVSATAVGPVVTNVAGDGIDLASGVSVQGLTVSGASADGLHGAAITTAAVGTTSPVVVSGSGGDGVELSGAANGAVTIGASIDSSAGRSVAVSGRSGGTTTFSGSISGRGVELAGNTNATIAFSGNLTLATTTTSAFSATGGGAVTATGTGSTLTSTTGTALVVDSTTIGAAGLTFRSVSSNGAVNGIRLNATGSGGGLSVTGNGSTTRGGDASGGTIANSTGAGVSLTSTRSVALNNLTVSNSTGGPGVSGTGVINFVFSNGTVTGSGSSSHGLGDSSLAFNTVSNNITNLAGAVTVTNNVLGSAYQSGVDVYNQAGIITSLTVTSNDISSSSSAASSKGSAVLVQAVGGTGGAAIIGTGSISSNTISGFPSGGGILLYGGNVSGAASSGFGSVGSPVTVSSNAIRGASSAAPMATQLILVAMAGRGSGGIDITNNGTVGQPLAFNVGNAISINSTGAFTLRSTVSGNVVSPQTQISGAFGIAGGADKQTMADTTVIDSAVLELTVTNNTVTSQAASGIRFLANSSGTVRARITGNTIATPLDQSGQSGIRIDSGTGSLTAVDTNVCLDLTNNSTSGSVNSAFGGTAPGIALRKQGTVLTTNDFGIVGIGASPASAAAVVSYISTVNPASSVGAGSYGTARAYIVSGDNFSSCTLPF